MSQQYPYPFDPTGTFPSNRIKNELAIVTVANGINAYLIRPDATPFYGTTLVIVNENGSALVEGEDYLLTHHWAKASEVTGLDVFGTITLLNGYAVGNYRLNYQTIGGEYVTAPLNAIQSGITASVNRNVTLDWSTAPIAFPVIPHNEELSNYSGMTQVYQALHKIADAIRSPTQGVHYDDLIGADIANVLSTVEPIIELVKTVALLHNDQAKIITQLKDNLDPLLRNQGELFNLKHYSIPLFGNLIVKVGTLTIDAGTQPGKIVFVNPPFPHRALIAFATITNKLTTSPVVKDQIHLGRPGKASVKVEIDYFNPTPTGTRVITYLAIGM